MGILNNIKASFYKKIGKPEKVYPVEVNIYQKRADSKIKIKDRGRAVKESDTDDYQFELMNFNHDGPIYAPYDHFVNRKDGSNEINFVLQDRNKIVPVKEKVAEDEEELRKTTEQLDNKDFAEKEFEKITEIVKSKDDALWKQDWFQAVTVFVGAGLFFILASYGQGQLFMEPLTQEMSELRNAIQAQGTSAAGGS
jgi:hypothetical protein